MNKMISEYIILEKNKSDFQKVLNQWNNNYTINIIWMYYDTIELIYRALIKRIRLMI